MQISTKEENEEPAVHKVHEKGKSGVVEEHSCSHGMAQLICPPRARMRCRSDSTRDANKKILPIVSLASVT